ncbi:MAG: metallophosphoesterase family protein [Thermoleophilaceae bacterium]
MKKLLRRPGRGMVMRVLAGIVVVVAFAVGGIALALRVAGPSEYDTAIGRVALKVQPRWHGRVDAFIPIADWGVRAHAFAAPVRLEIEPRTLDRQALLRAVGGDGTILARAERDATRAAHRTLLRALLFAVGGGLAAGVLLALILAATGRRSRRMIAVGVALPALTALLLAGGALLRLQATFDSTAFEHPSFYARGAELNQLLNVAEKAQAGTKSYSSSVQRSIAGYATLLSAGSRLTDVTAGPRALLASDFHNNVLVIKPLARLFSGGPAFVPGDFGQSGTAAEARLLVPRVRTLGKPVIAVSGNHDSRLIMRRLAAAGVVVLERDGRLLPNGKTDGKPVQQVAGYTIAGIQDPLEWLGRDPNDPRRVFSFAQRPHGTQEYAKAQQSVIEWFDSLPERPDMVMIHENGLAQNLARTLAARGGQDPLMILTGHDHKQHIDRYGKITVVDAGTAGAGGVFGARSTPVGVGLLYLEPHGLLPNAVDMVQVEPFTGAANAGRVVLDSKTVCDTRVVICHDKGGQGP